MRSLAAALLVSSAAAAQVLEDQPAEDADGGTASHATWLHFDGQKVLPEALYRTVLKLSPDAGADLATASEVSAQLEHFLHASGYQLAEVEAHLDADAGVHVLIDEGQLEKVVFRGRQTLQTIRFKLALDIPHDVFNRPEVERQVERLGKVLGLEGLRLVLVPSTAMKHVGPQLEDMPEVKGFELLHQRRAFELHLVLPDREWDTGVGLDIRLGYIDGLELRGNYQGRSGIFVDDRWRLTAWAAGWLRRHVVTDAFYPHLSRVAFDGEYFFPAIAGTGTLRPAIQARADLATRQRKDLSLVDYYASELSAAAWLEWEPSRGIRIQFGGGLFDRRLFGLLPIGPEHDPPAFEPGVGPQAGTRPFAALRLDFTFDPDTERWDRHHVLLVDLQQQFPGIGAGPFASVKVYYRFVQPFGWHDLWLRANGFAVWYESTFHDESSLGDYLHGAFASEFVRRAASVNTEFRFSLTRDLLKLGVWSEVAVFTAVDRSQDRGPLQLAAAFGPGIHLLLEGMFQLDGYVTFGLWPHFNPRPGVAAELSSSVTASLNLQKAF